MYYINIKTGREIETIDEFQTWKETREMIREYRMSYLGTGIFPYISKRSTKSWRDSK